MAHRPLLKQLQEIDFVLLELNLYLDTHPACRPGLEQYNRLAKQRADIAAAYEQEYGPLLHFGQNFSRYPWQWVDTPWPWQMD
jgi:spore coat protein JB